MRARLRLAANLFALLALVGLCACRRPADQYPDRTPPTASYPAASSAPLATGSVRGRVVWAGAKPTVPPIKGLIAAPGGQVWGEVPNPFAPSIDKDGGMADAVVWLEGVDPAKLKPWPHPPAKVEVRRERITVNGGRVGFARVGDEVEMVSKDGEFHLLRARGSAYFTLTFSEPDQPLKRKLGSVGVVEFTSAAGFFWAAADLWACDHPYYAATDAAGRFELSGVPPGEYTLRAWARNWAETGRDRDPETGKIARLTFADLFTAAVRVTVADGDTTAELRLK